MVRIWLLDALQGSTLVEQEAGGITQALQAFLGKVVSRSLVDFYYWAVFKLQVYFLFLLNICSVRLDKDAVVTVIDSPGQEIFFRMRDNAGACNLFSHH